MLLAVTRFIASSTLYYSCSANHNKQAMKSNHTDNAMEEQAPVLSLTLSPAFTLQMWVNTSAEISSPGGFLSIVMDLGLEFLSLPISRAPVWCSLRKSWVCCCQRTQPTPGGTINKQSQGSCSSRCWQEWQDKTMAVPRGIKLCSASPRT